MKSRNEVLLSFVQVGKSKAATKWLESLEDILKTRGAKFDIIDAVTTSQYKGFTLPK